MNLFGLPNHHAHWEKISQTVKKNFKLKHDLGTGFKIVVSSFEQDVSFSFYFTEFL